MLASAEIQGAPPSKPALESQWNDRPIPSASNDSTFCSKVFELSYEIQDTGIEPLDWRSDSPDSPVSDPIDRRGRPIVVVQLKKQ